MVLNKERQKRCRERKNGASPSRWSLLLSSVSVAQTSSPSSSSSSLRFLPSLRRFCWCCSFFFIFFYLICINKSVMDFLCASSTCIKIDSLTFLHLEYINMLLICINIFFLFSFCLCMNFSFTFFASTFISFPLFSVFFFLVSSICVVFNTALESLKRKKKLMKNNTDSQTTKQTVYYSNFYALFLYRMITEEVCGTTSMVHTHSHSQ